MIGAIGLLLAVGLAIAGPSAPVGGEDRALQRIHELQWDREPPLALVAEAAGAGREARAAVAVSLGRLQDPDALDPLRSMTEDPELEVRLAVAEALGLTPGAADAIAAWLAEAPRPRGPAARAMAADGLVVRLITALGRQGEGRHLPILLAHLDEPWPIGAAAARAVGALDRRGILVRQERAGVARTLVAALDRPDPRLLDAVAEALERVGLADDPTLGARVAARAAELPRGAARASLLAAAWPTLDHDARSAAFLAAIDDPWRAVRVAALEALQPGDLAPEIVGTWLSSPDPWLRIAALDALGRIAAGSDGIEAEIALDELQRLADHAADAWVRAAAVRHGAVARRGDEPVVQAAAVGRIDDADPLVELALSDPSPAVRTAAVGALARSVPDDDAAVALGEALLSADDPVVRRAAVGWLARTEEGIARLWPHLGAEQDASVLRAALDPLTRAVEQGAIDAGDDDLLQLLKRSSGHASLRPAAAALAQAVGAPLESDAARGRPYPSLSEARAIRGARVLTERGTFTLQLDPHAAPLAVATFAALADDDFYDGLVVYDVEPGAVVRTGCPRSDGQGDPGFTVPAEVSGRPLDVGAVAMGEEGAVGSRLVVVTGRAPHLDGAATRIGSVVAGLEVAARLQPGDRILDVRIERVEP